MSVPAQAVDDRPDWRDAKRYWWLLGLLVPALPFLGAGLVRVTGLRLFWWFGPIFLYLLIPLLDLRFGADGSNVPEAVVPRIEADPYYRWCTWAFLPLQYAGLVWACWMWSRGGLAFVDALGLALTIGVVNGGGINTAHELGHKSETVERWLSKIALAPTCYGHFYVEHNRGHHARVATPEDPASARLGESFWAFLPRTVFGSVASAWEIERRRLEAAGRSVWSAHNDVLNAWVMSGALALALAAAFGASVLPWLAVQAVFGFTLLETVNYLEHYGLARQKLPDGRYEPCAPKHSWNSNAVTSNLVLYHLQRHADHHAHPKRRYQALRHFAEAPELPTGYGSMIPLAYFTPLWRRVMDPRVTAHYGGNLSLANVQPGQRGRYGLS
jgi:alkane 1-monooxygenase